VAVHPSQRFLIMKNTGQNIDLLEAFLHPDDAPAPKP
jgi:hypothetical protein